MDVGRLAACIAVAGWLILMSFGFIKLVSDIGRLADAAEKTSEDLEDEDDND